MGLAPRHGVAQRGGLLTHVRGEDLDDGALVRGRIGHEAFEGVDAAEADRDVLGAQVRHGVDVLVGRLSGAFEPVGVGARLVCGAAAASTLGRVG